MKSTKRTYTKLSETILASSGKCQEYHSLIRIDRVFRSLSNLVDISFSSSTIPQCRWLMWYACPHDWCRAWPCYGIPSERDRVELRRGLDQSNLYLWSESVLWSLSSVTKCYLIPRNTYSVTSLALHFTGRISLIDWASLLSWTARKCLSCCGMMNTWISCLMEVGFATKSRWALKWQILMQGGWCCWELPQLLGRGGIPANQNGCWYR